MSLLFNMLSRLVITSLPRSKCLLISWQQSPFAVLLEPQNHFGLQDYSGFLFTRSNLRTRSETISSLLENGRRNSHFLKTYFESGSLVETFIYLFHWILSFSFANKAHLHDKYMKFKRMTKLNWEKKTFLNTIFLGKTARLMGWLADWHLWLNLF